MAEKSGKTTREHLEVLRQHLQGLGEKMSHGEVVDDEDVRMAIFHLDTIGDSLPAAPVTAAAPPPPIAMDAETVRTDGPTLEEYVGSGRKPEDYPPEGYAERDSPGLRKLRARQAHDTWIAGGKVGPAPGPAPEEESTGDQSQR